MSKHTPGPWIISPKIMKPNHTPVIGVSSPGNWINLAGVYSTKRGDESKANARLIAAAPDLLEACKRFVGPWDQTTLFGIFAQARAAIAKATGQA